MENLRIFVVSDRITAIKNVTINFSAFVLFDGFKPIYEIYLNVSEIPPLSAIEIPFENEWKAFKMFVNKFSKNNNDFLFQANFIEILETFPATLLPDKFYHKEQFGNVSLEYLKLLPTGYLIELNTTNIQPLVWIDLKHHIKSTGIIFHFDMNGFVMTKPNYLINLQIFDNPKNITLKLNDFSVTLL